MLAERLPPELTPTPMPRPLDDTNLGTGLVRAWALQIVAVWLAATIVIVEVAFARKATRHRAA